MPEIFTWKNCWADIHTYRYGAIAQEFLAHVVNPSLDALDAQIAEHRKSDDPVSEFYISDLTELINKTRMAFCLSIQSLWEQQIRAYLHGCQKQLGINPFPISPWKKNETIHSATWGRELDTVFLKLRGIPLTIFASYKKLDLLQTVGNVCRHGDGDSSARLWQISPEFWPLHSSDAEFKQNGNVPSVQMMVLPRRLLAEFVDAICLFWDDMEYIYNESISPKHHTLEEKLALRWEDPTKGVSFDEFVSAITVRGA